MTAANDAARDAARAFTEAVAEAWRARLGGRLLGVWFIGSLAHGGFSRRYSDIDMALAVDGGLTQGELDALRGDAAPISPEHAAKLSVFWADRDFAAGRFPPLDRIDFIDHGVALIENEATRPARPTLAEVRDYLRGDPFATWAANADKFAALDSLAPQDHKPYLRAHLYPARFVYSWVTGSIASNDDAVAFVAARQPDGLDVELIVRALRCRDAARDPDSLFPDRIALPRQVEACRRIMAGP